jgi:predicted RND superfamily exporter protein
VNNLVRFALRRPAATLGAALALTLAFAAGLPRLETAVGYRALLGDAHPSVARFDAFLERYEGGLPLALVYACEGQAPCRSVFDGPALEMARDVSAALAVAPGVRGVLSPANATLWVPGRPPLPPRPRRFVEAGEPAPDREALALRALRDREWLGTLVSADGRTGAIVVELASSAGPTAQRVWEAAERAKAPFEARGFRFAAIGGPVEFVVAGGELEAAARRLVPLMVGLVALGLVLLLRAPGASLALLATVGVGVVWTQGLLGWLGWPQNTVTQILPPIVLVIGTCNGLHLVARQAAARAERPQDDASAQLLRAAGEVGGPCAMMTATTLAGFLSFLPGGVEAFARFGVAAAFGVAASLLLSFSVLPLALLRVPPPPIPEGGAPRSLEALLARTARGVRRHWALVLVGALAIAAACGAGMARLRVDARFEDLYGEDSRVVQWVRFAGERLRPPDTLEVELILPAGADVADPATLAVLSEAVQRLTALPDAGRVRSLLDPLSAAHRLATGDDPQLERPAATRRGNRLLLELLARDPARPLARHLDPSEGRVRLSVETWKLPQDRLRAFVAGAEQALGAALPSGWSFGLTGPIVLVRDMLEAIQASQRSSFLQAWATVGLLVTLFLRSLPLGALVMVPTVLPVVATVGAMGVLGIPLDPGSAMVAAVALGISDDDAIHLLAQYRRLRREGAAAADAVEGALLHAGRAIVTTSTALALGFAALVLSPWKSVASFGLLTALAIGAALGAVLVVLPAVLYGAARLSGAAAAGGSSAPRSSS